MCVDDSDDRKYGIFGCFLRLFNMYLMRNTALCDWYTCQNVIWFLILVKMVRMFVVAVNMVDNTALMLLMLLTKEAQRKGI